MFERGENGKTILSHESQIWNIVHCITAIWTVQGAYTESVPDHQVSFAQLEIKQYYDL